MGPAAMAIRGNGGVQKCFAGRRKGFGRMEKMAVELVVRVVGRDEGEEEGFSVREFIAAEEGVKEGEEGREGEVERRDVGVGPFVESED